MNRSNWLPRIGFRHFHEHLIPSPGSGVSFLVACQKAAVRYRSYCEQFGLGKRRVDVAAERMLASGLLWDVPREEWHVIASAIRGLSEEVRTREMRFLCDFAGSMARLDHLFAMGNEELESMVDTLKSGEVG